MRARRGDTQGGTRWVTLAAVIGAGLALTWSCRQAAAPPEPPALSANAPRLILVVVVDQMRFDYLTRFRPLFTGGLRRLLDQGAVFTNAYCGYANADTAPGHSVVLSGLFPAESGIVANEWYESATRRRVNAIEDPDDVVLGGAGRAASPRHARGPTLAEALKRVAPASRVVGVSVKHRGAVLLVGRGAEAAYWLDTSTGRFVTSSYYMRQLPPWFVAARERNSADRYAGATWARLLPDEALYVRLAGEDAAPGELHDNTLPQEVPREPFSDDGALCRTPFADEMVAELALDALAGHRLGGDEHTDVLGVSLSATDAIGHAYGPDSHEAMDQILRVDRLLGRLLTEVERRVPANRLLVVLTADHGIMSLPEVLRRRGIDAQRVKPAVIEAAIRKALAARYPKGSDLVARIDGPDVYLDLAALETRGLRRTEVEEVVRRALLSTGVVEAVYTHAQLQGPKPADDPYFDLFRNSFFAERSPHLMGRLKRHVYLSEKVGGTGHGSPEEYDRHVPIIFLGAGIRSGERSEPCGPQDIAPTLARRLGIPYPGADGRPLALGERAPAP